MDAAVSFNYGSPHIYILQKLAEDISDPSKPGAAVDEKSLVALKLVFLSRRSWKQRPTPRSTDLGLGTLTRDKRGVQTLA